MIRTALFTTSFALLAAPALALSCLQPDIARSFDEAQKAEEAYVVVHGTLSFDASTLPKEVSNDNPPVTKVPARLEGRALSKTGFDHEFARDVTLEVLCFGPWCGGATPGETLLGFIRKDDDGYTLSVDPCGSLTFPDPDQKVLDKVAACFRDGRCPAN